MHRAALALGIAAAPPGELRHHALGIHAAGEHVTVIAIAGDHLVAVALGHLHADDDRLLADIEVAEPPDQPHAVHLAGLLLETPDQQHLAERLELLFLGEFRDRACVGRRRGWAALFRDLIRVFGFGDGHQRPRNIAGFIP